MRRAISLSLFAVLSASCADLPPEPQQPLVVPGAFETAHSESVPLAWQKSSTGFDVLMLGDFNGIPLTPLDVNDAGQVVGVMRPLQAPFISRGFLWENGVITDLGPVTTPSVAHAISESGVFAGMVGPDPVMWAGNGMVILPRVSGATRVRGLNDQGDMVGSGFPSDAFLWTNGLLQGALPKPPGTIAEAYDINNNGVILGSFRTGFQGAGRLAVWTNGVLAEIPLPAGQSLGPVQPNLGGRLINDAGEFVGNLTSAGIIRGFRYRNGTLEVLPVLSPGSQTWAYAISETGDVVGSSPFQSFAQHAVLWRTDGSLIDLGTLPGYLSSHAAGMNRNGWVVGHSTTINPVVNITGAIWRLVSDETAPQIASSIQGTLGTNGWYTSDVQVTWTLTDAETAITTTQGCDPLSIVTDTPGSSFTCSAANSLGLASTNTVDVKRDATTPTVTFSAHPESYDVDELVSIQCAANDATSGIATHTCADVTADAYTLGLGTHVYTAAATDNAGNTASTETRLVVRVTIAGLCRLTRRFVTTAGAANALCQKLDAAAAALDRGNENNARQILDAFGQQVRALDGESITAEKAGVLQALADAIP